MKPRAFLTLLVAVCLSALLSITFSLLPFSSHSASAHSLEPQVTDQTSGNWGGYVASFNNPQSGDTLSVSAAWTIPSVTCTKNGTPISGIVGVWPGLGGVAANNILEQIGTASQCTSGKATYWAWYEYYPIIPPYHIMKDGNYPVSPGDAIRADVTDQGYGYFVLRLFDDTKGWHYTKIWINQSANAIPQTAEWIVEQTGTQTFPKFYNVLFSNCYWVQNGPQNALATGTNLTRYTIIQQQFPFNPKETTLDVFPDGTDFSVYWNRF